jgi:hypothetical protein
MVNLPTDTSPLRFYLGPVGALRHLPAMPRGINPQVTPRLVEAVQENLSGGQYSQIFGVKRTWRWRWEWLSQGDFEFLRAAQSGLQVSPLRVVDQRQRNRLSEEVASGGTLLRRTSKFAISGGTFIWRTLTVPGLEPVLGGGLEWVAPLNGVLSLVLAERVPIHSDWSSYTLSCYAAGSGTARIQAVQQDATGATPTTINGTSVALTGTFQRLSVTAAYTAGKSLLDFNVQATVAGTMQLTGFQIQTSALSSWVSGAGCPEVKIRNVEEVYAGVSGGSNFYSVSASAEEV